MFTLDTVVDTAVKSAKGVLAYVPDSNIRSGFETIVEAQAEFAKTIWNSSLELNTQAWENLTQLATNKASK